MENLRRCNVTIHFRTKNLPAQNKSDCSSPHKILNDLNPTSKKNCFPKIWLRFDGLFRFVMDTLRTGAQNFEIFMEHLWCFFESFTDFFGNFGYFVAFFELVMCLRIVIGMWTILELKMFGTNFYSVLTFVLKIIFGKN